MKRLLFLIVIVFYTGIVLSQTEKNVTHQALIWSRYVNQLELNEKFTLVNDIDYRIFINPVEQNSWVFRTQLRDKVSDKMEVGVGFAYFSTTTQDPEVTKPFHTPEYRVQQDVTIKQDFGKTKLNHRYQLEERWVQKATASSLELGFNFAFRFRYKLEADWVVWESQKSTLKAIFYDEIMLNGGNKIVKNTFDQNRIYGGLQFSITPDNSMELGLLNSFQQKSNGTDYLDRNNIRLSFYHKLKL